MSTSQTDAKIAILQAYVDAYVNADPVAATSLFLSDGRLTFEAPPQLDEVTGQYRVPFINTNVGHEQILAIISSLIEGHNLTATIHHPRVAGDTVSAPGTVASPDFPALGTPVTKIDGVFTAQIRGGKIVHLHWAYTQEALDALPAAAQSNLSTGSGDRLDRALRPFW